MLDLDVPACNLAPLHLGIYSLRTTYFVSLSKFFRCFNNFIVLPIVLTL